MFKRFIFAPFALIALAAVAAVSSPIIADTDEGPMLRVTVTNLTRGQVLSPPVVAVHDGSLRLFEPGAAASDELAQLAEDAVAGPLLGQLGTMDGVLEATAGTNPIPPGSSDYVDISVRGRFRYVAVAGMLVTTNDAFYAATGPAFGPGSARTFTAIAWDAGSEANTESCAHIPGPPCGNPLVPVTDGAEGFVHIHAGVHGGSSLVPSQHDWNNPTALIRIERLD